MRETTLDLSPGSDLMCMSHSEFGRDQRHRNKGRQYCVTSNVAGVDHADFRQLTPAPICRNIEWKVPARQKRQGLLLPFTGFLCNLAFFLLNTLQQCGSWFVFRVLLDDLAADGKIEDKS